VCTTRITMSRYSTPTPLSFFLSFHSFNIVFVMTFTQFVLFSLSLWYSPFLTTIIRYARIIISTFYAHIRTHTHTHVFHLLILQHACLYIDYYRRCCCCCCCFCFSIDTKKQMREQRRKNASLCN